MRALLVYESMFGNTQLIANAVAAGLATSMEVDVVEVGRAPTAIGGEVGLLVVGGPTHVFGLSRPQTRQSAVEQAGRTEQRVISTGSGLREWLAEVTVPDQLPAATFGTRVRRWFVPGSSARRAHHRLHQRGCRLVLPPESFWVADTPGPLLADEPARARQWGEQLAARLAGQGPSRG